MATLHMFVCLLGLVVLCHSQCLFKRLVGSDPANPPKGCVDEHGELHGFGERWKKDCVMCFCDAKGLTCCPMIPTPDVTDIPDECELVVNKQTCSAKVVLRSNHNQDCIPV